MITRNARKRQSGPEITLLRNDSTSCTTPKQVGRKRKSFKIEEPMPAFFNIHVHVPLVGDQKLLKSLVQPQIHLHFNSTLGSLGARNSIQTVVTSENGNFKKLFSVVTKKSENVNYSPSKFTRRNSLKKIKLAVDEDVDNEGRVGQKRRRISSVSSTKSFQKSKDDSEMPSLENKLKKLVRGHVRKRLFNCDSKSNDTSGPDSNENNDSFHCSGSKNENYNTYSLKKAVVLLQDIGCRQAYNLSEFEKQIKTPRTKFRHSSQKDFKDCSYGEIEGFVGKTSTPLRSPVNKKNFFEKLNLREDMPINNQNLSQKGKKNNDVSLENKRDNTKNSDKNFASQSFDLKDKRTHSEQNKKVELKSREKIGKHSTDTQEKVNDYQFNENNSTNLKEIPKHNDQEKKETAMKVCDTIQKLISEVEKKKIVFKNKSKSGQSNNQSTECNKENNTISLFKEVSKPKGQTWNLEKTVPIKSVSQVDDMGSNNTSVVLSNENPECNLNKQIEDDNARKTVIRETSPIKIDLKTNKFASLGSIPETHTEEPFQKDKKSLKNRKNESVEVIDKTPEHLSKITEIEKEKGILVENNSYEKEESENIDESLNESSHYTNQKTYSGDDETCAMENEILKRSKIKKRNNKSKKNTALNTREKGMVSSCFNKNEIEQTLINSSVNITLNEERKTSAKDLFCKEKKKKTSNKINKENKKKCNNESFIKERKQKSNVHETEPSATKQKSKDVKEKFINHLSDTTEDETEEKVPLSLDDTAFWSVKRRNGRVYSLVYKSDSDDSQSQIISSLTSLANGCNFSEILKKFKNKNLREKILLSIKNNEQNKFTTEEPLGGSLNDVTSNNDGELEKNSNSDVGVDENMSKMCSNSVQKNTPKKAMKNTIGSTKSPDMGSISDNVEETLSEDLNVQFQEKEFNDTEIFNISDRELGSVQEKQVLSQKVEASLNCSDFLEIQLETIKKEMLNKGILKKRKNERMSPKKASRLKETELSMGASSPKKKKSDKKVDVTSKSKNTRKKDQKEEKEDYIPLNVSGPTKFAVVPLNKINPYKNHGAANLKTELIFNRNKRFAFSLLRTYQEKQHASQKASESSNKT